MQRDDPTGQRPGGPAPVGPGADTVLAALAHRLRARSERQQLLTERLRSGELRPGALADLAELAAAARRGVRDGDHVLVMAGAEVPDRGSGGGPVPLGQALSAAVAASEAASRTVVPPTPSLSLEPSAGPVFAQIMAELLAHATAATAPGERLELHTRWGPDGGLVLELLSPRPVPTRTPLDDLDRMLAAGRPDGPVAPQEIGLYLAARLARAIGGRLGVRGSPGVASAPGPSPIAVLQLPPSVLGGGSRSSDAVSDDPGVPEVADLPESAAGSGPVGEEPTGVVPSASSDPFSAPTSAAPPAPAAAPSSDPEPSVPPWPPLPVADAESNPPPGNGLFPNGSGPLTTVPNGPESGPVPNGSGPLASFPNGAVPADPGPNGLRPNGAAPEPGTSGEPQDGSGSARLPVPPPPEGSRPSVPRSGPAGPTGAGLQIPPGSRGPAGPPVPGHGRQGFVPPRPNENGPNEPGPNQTGPDQGGADRSGANQGGASWSGTNPAATHEPGPSQAGPGWPDPNHRGANKTAPDQAGSNRAGTNWPGTNQAWPSGPSRPGPNQPGSHQPGPPPGQDRPGRGPSGPNPPGPVHTGPNGIGPAPDQPLPNGIDPTRSGPGRPGTYPSAPHDPLDVPPVTEALPVSGTTPPVELFGPFDSEVPVPVDDLDGTPIFAAVASAWFRDPSTPPNGGPPPPNGHGPGAEPTNWTTAGDAEFQAARSRADRVVEPPVNANGLPMRRPGQQMVPPARRDTPGSTPQAPAAAERQPDRVRNRLASYQRGLREGRHRAAEESAGADMNGAASHGRNGHAAG